MKCFQEIFCLAWAFICLIEVSELVPQNWTPEERSVYEQLRQQDCGVLSNILPIQRLRRRITGGRKSSLMSQPWMAFLYIPEHLEICRCGGSLISESFVLTAAHCIKLCPRFREIRVRLGEHDLNSSQDCTTYDYKKFCAPPVEEFSIEKAIIHEEFNPFSAWFDVALLKLDRKVVFKDHIRPICLPLTDQLLAFTSNIGQSFLAVGWGKTEDLRFANTSMEVYINTETCTGGRDNSFLCANGDFVDTCTGDSGGPLTWSILHLGAVRTVQFGVVSYGSTECGAGQKAYYMDVPTYMPWIIKKLAKFSQLRVNLDTNHLR
ncbi:serine protease grass [Drosophila biarmipes]|uniref:serine protease grass n=1 Tax=Drosophila biarmipes TaxID=125945 RepID=UPI0007E73834|nr:serine protease grass [Drosophila biarmipes]